MLGICQMRTCHECRTPRKTIQEWEKYASVGISSLLIGVCLVGLVITLWSSQQFRIAGPESNTAAILAVSLASIGLDTRAKGGSESAVIGTVLMALSATLLVSGVVSC